ncbi:branched-chain amino acid transport system ATP-binding protein [Lutimaribacter pacificus]|uniref:Amino acid/amide ABC transporter ATP-binding protein 1, HAAT family n=1 Tax=Lutimaribacter pacificus TaxID=391948 RepID=A0A1H0M0W1_9RHOB|nr:ABC transporter ATP-binding protein [Lutimaribacter pacificus]SDO73984.1 branched-chain amino acid transport system ATP-binding protein [Lutimaribacter pacificus]SHK76251.1 amino acid/amide ABC transporter ATP-binding protein 1, HAAT family [Lutimaribacter pacificus]
MTRIMEARAMHKSYGQVKVLEDVSFDLEEGEAHVVIGPNGAGKTTLFRCLSGETRINSGSIMLNGQDVTGLAGWQRVQRGIGRSFQVARIFQDMSAFENLIVAIETRERSEKGLWASFGHIAPRRAVMDEAERLVHELGLEGTLDDPAGTLSHGDKKRLELAMSLALRPKVLMLDEPTAGMSPSDRSEAVRLISDVRARYGLTLLLTEHDMEVVFGLATRLTVLHHGAIIASGEPHKVRADARVREVYLGQH